MSGWYDWPEWGGYRSNEYGRTVHEKGPDDKPILYDPRGKPLTREKRVGFRPPKEEKK